MKKIFLALFTLSMILSCYTGSEDRDEYEIVSLLWDSLSKRAPIPPPFMDQVTEKDSLKFLHTYNRIKDSLDSVKQVVAINPFMEAVRLKPENFNGDQRKLVVQLNSLKDNRLLNFEAVVINRKKDSIVLFKKGHLRKQSADYKGIDRLISFSRIAFNEERTEAAVVASTGTSRLDSHTAVYFFRNIHEKWVLVDWKNLSIS